MDCLFLFKGEQSLLIRKLTIDVTLNLLLLAVRNQVCDSRIKDVFNGITIIAFKSHI